MARRQLRGINIWAGFVEALTSLVLAFIFVLLIFVVAQFTLSDVLTGRDEALMRLYRQVEELARYRSEFFGRLREILGNRQDIRIVGDRFVFQSEVLFPTASADLNPQGEQTLRRLADTLKEITPKIPQQINWILEVDGYTDKRPITTSRFPSNWELSTARATAVVKFLAANGVAPEHLSATGFGEFQPIDSADNESAYAKNRRIEFKLTQR